MQKSKCKASNFITGGKMKLSYYSSKSTKHFGELYQND